MHSGTRWANASVHRGLSCGRCIANTGNRAAADLPRARNIAFASGACSQVQLRNRSDSSQHVSHSWFTPERTWLRGGRLIVPSLISVSLILLVILTWVSAGRGPAAIRNQSDTASTWNSSFKAENDGLPPRSLRSTISSTWRGPCRRRIASPTS
jgi:hypothetical protein